MNEKEKKEQPEEQTSSIWRQVLVAYVREQAQPIEKFSHQPRLFALTQQIAANLSADEDVLFAAAYLHDLGVFYGHRPSNPEELGNWDNTAYAMREAPQILKGIGFPVEKIDDVVYCIASHQPHSTPETLEAIILRDADILEQLGAIAIMRTVSKIGRDTRFHTFADAQRALQHALDALPQRLSLETARILAAPRISALASFLIAFSEEAREEL
jgi:uncharacterized protein